MAVVLLPRAIVARPPTSAGVLTQPQGPVPEIAAPHPAPAPAPAAGPVVTSVPVAPSLAPPLAATAATNGNGHGLEHAYGNGNGNGLASRNGHDLAPAPDATLAPPTAAAPLAPRTAEAVSGLRRRVRAEDAAPATGPAEAVHGPAQSADDVRSTWCRTGPGRAAGPAGDHRTTDSAQEGTAP